MGQQEFSSEMKCAHTSKPRPSIASHMLVTVYDKDTIDHVLCPLTSRMWAQMEPYFSASVLWILSWNIPEPCIVMPGAN